MASTRDVAGLNTIGDYTVGGVIGHGLVGVLREGTYVPGDRAVVLEEVPPGLSGDAEFTRQLAEAGRVLSDVNSDHLCAVYDVIRDGDRLMVVGEPPGGPSLAGAIAKRPLSPADAVAVAADVLDGLSALHGARLHHGSVSGATVFLADNGAARLGECAVAAAASAGSRNADLEAVTRMVFTLIGAGEMPGAIATALRRAPGRGATSPYPDAAAYRDALIASAEAIWGGEWRAATDLGERAATVPATPAAAALPAALPLSLGRRGTREAAEAATDDAPPPRSGRTRRRWLLPTVLLVIAAVAVGGVFAVVQYTTDRAESAALSVAPGVHVSETTVKTGACDTTFEFAAQGSVTGTGTLTYRWERSDGVVLSTQSLQIDGHTTSAFALTAAWRLQGAQKLTGTMTFHILAPADVRASAPVSFTC